MEPSTLFVYILIGTGLVYAYALFQFCDALKRFHPTEWEQLGRPTMFVAPFTFKRDKMDLPYIWARRYESIGDKRLTFFGDLLRLCSMVLVVIGLFYVLLLSDGKGKIGIRF